MKNILSNSGYFLKETFTIIRLSFLSSIFSFLSIGLILFILAVVLSGWRISSGITESIGDQAEVSVYYDQNFKLSDASTLAEKIKRIGGVRDARLVEEKDAYSKMVRILGKEAEILKVFDENPFTSYIEVNINMDSVESILNELNKMTGIEYIRDNRDILDRLASITRLITFIGYLVLTAAGISTLVIISHIIRLAIQNNREQINTLTLLGAPRTFIALPFLLQGLLLTLGGGILASLLAAFSLNQIYLQITSPLPFIPLPPLNSIISEVSSVIMAASAALGFTGSLLGFTSSRRR